MTMGAVAEAEHQGIPRIKATYGYYRQPNGWITLSPAADLDELKYIRRGWTPLRQYGRVEMTSPYAVDHPLEALFMAGGVRELPREQVIMQALHLNSLMIPGCNKPLSQFHKRHTAACMANAYELTFPQLGPGDMKSYQCRFCDRDPFSTEKAQLQHEGVAHKEEKGDISTGNALAEALVKGLRGSGVIGSAESESRVLGVLEQVGLNKSQIRALREAGLIAGDEDESEG